MCCGDNCSRSKVKKKRGKKKYLSDSSKNDGEDNRTKEELEEEYKNFLKMKNADEDLNPQVVVAKGYLVRGHIGEGGFSQVYSAEDLNAIEPENRKLAAKIVKFDEVSPEWKDAQLKKEMQISKKISHENLIKSIDVVKTQRRAFMFMERARGPLEGMIVKKYGSHKRVPEKEAKKIFKQIVAAVSYLHSRNIAHRDLKMDNVLVGMDGQIKIADLGFATLSKRSKLSNTDCGTLEYTAPEILDPDNTKGYDAKKSDVFALGVILYELLYGKVPFDIQAKDPMAGNTAEEKRNHLKNIKKNKIDFPTDVLVSKEAKSLIEKMLRFDPKKRPSASRVMDDIWLVDGWFKKLVRVG